MGAQKQQPVVERPAIVASGADNSSNAEDRIPFTPTVIYATGYHTKFFESNANVEAPGSPAVMFIHSEAPIKINSRFDNHPKQQFRKVCKPGSSNACKAVATSINLAMLAYATMWPWPKLLVLVPLICEENQASIRLYERTGGP